ncbi:AAA family ATPase [Bdellovibrionota bacterium FG-2]
MPHERARHVQELFSKIAAHSPLVGCLGHRQVGKTTFLAQIGKHYLTLDDPNVLARARRAPKEFVAENARKGAVVIDECQHAPELFPALKEWVRTHKKPGQFYMSGSVRFTSRSAIRESLTGRIMNVEIFPFGVAELAGLPLPSLVLDLASTQNFRRIESLTLTSHQQRDRAKIVDQYLEAGGLPGVCFMRDSKARTKRIEEQIYTILDRDIRTVYPLKLAYRQILEFLGELANAEGEPINHSFLKSRTGISPITQKKLLYALEAVFVIRMHRIQSENTKWTYLFEDQAEWRWLAQQQTTNEDALLEKQWAGLIYRNLRLQSEYILGAQDQLFGYQTRSGVHVPLAIQTEKGILGILPLLTDDISHRSLMAAHSFLKRFGNSSVLFVSKTASRPRIIDERIGLIPASLALFE